jgi:hypothetical protein
MVAGLADNAALPFVTAYGRSKRQATAPIQALALHLMRTNWSASEAFNQIRGRRRPLCFGLLGHQRGPSYRILARHGWPGRGVRLPLPAPQTTQAYPRSAPPVSRLLSASANPRAAV